MEVVASTKEETKMKTAAATSAKKPTKSGKKITVLAKQCPVRKGTNRARYWSRLKTGVTTGEVDVPIRFIKKMAKAGHLKLG